MRVVKLMRDARKRGETDPSCAYIDLRRRSVSKVKFEYVLPRDTRTQSYGRPHVTTTAAAGCAWRSGRASRGFVGAR